MFESADPLGAARLPNGAHRRAAGTDALTDVLVFRRRLTGEEPGDPTRLETSPVPAEVGSGARINDYFTNNPEKVLGNVKVAPGRFGSATPSVRAEDLQAVPAQLHERANTSGLPRCRVQREDAGQARGLVQGCSTGCAALWPVDGRPGWPPAGFSRKHGCDATAPTSQDSGVEGNSLRTPPERNPLDEREGRSNSGAHETSPSNT